MSEIIITLKLYSGIDKELNIRNYDNSLGIMLNVQKGSSLRSILKQAGIRKLSRFIYFCSGHHVSLWKRFYEPAEVSCLKVSGGG